jgi:hypothetical protein
VPEIDGREGVIGKRRGLDSAARAYRLGDRDARLKESAGTICAALMGNYRPEHVLALPHALQPTRSLEIASRFHQIGAASW